MSQRRILWADDQIDELRDDLHHIDLYHGTIVSKDEQAAAIFVTVSSDSARIKRYRQLREVIAARGATPERIDVIGAPVAEALLGTHILEDLGVPSAVTGDRTTGALPEGWHWPRSVYEWRRLVARRIGLVPVAMKMRCAVIVFSPTRTS